MEDLKKGEYIVGSENEEVLSVDGREGE